MRRNTAVAVALILIVAVAGWYFFFRPRSGPREGRKAPAVTVTERATSQPLHLPADLAGQPFALQFFSYT